MAKTTKRGAAPGAPRPKIEPKPIPLLRRRGVRWTALGVLLAVGLFVTLLILGNVSRANTLRAYDEDLQVAMRPFSQHNVAGAPDSFIDAPTAFTNGAIGAGELESSAQRWTDNFADAAAKVRELEVPEPLQEANEVIAQSMDLYTDVARSYLLLAEESRLQRRARGATADSLAEQLQAWGTQIQRTRRQADAMFAYGNRIVQELKQSWGVAPAEPDFSNLEELPPGFGTEGGSNGG